MRFHLVMLLVVIFIALGMHAMATAGPVTALRGVAPGACELSGEATFIEKALLVLRTGSAE